MKSKLLFPIILVTGIMLFNFSMNRVNGQAQSNQLTAKQQTIMYTCTMHPEVLQNMPGNCPICGMKLVEKKYESSAGERQESDSTIMKHSQMKMDCDTTAMKQEKMMQDSTSMKHDPVDMER